MRYKVNGYCIKSENAAKPCGQASQYLVGLLKDLAPFAHALDFGCGKLRYAQHLYHCSRRLTLTDSAEQLKRQQVVLGEFTSVRGYVHDWWYDSRVLDLTQLRTDRTKYDFVLCANVLSAIPDCSDRVAALRSLASKVTKSGSILVGCQYTNSYFCNRMRDKNVTKYNDGFILGPPSNASFYGLVNLDRLTQYIESAGFVPNECWRNDQTAYVLAKVRQ